MNKKFYVTTPIYYPNDLPHVGTAYTTIICDILARYKRQEGYDVRFITGTDEHGQKIEEAAKKNGYTPEEWTDKISDNFVNTWKKLNISNTDFLRTTETRHLENVRKIVQKAYDNGDIYKGEYIGKYCVSEETFVTDSQLVDGKYMGKEVIEVKENSYFFKLSKYQDRLLEYIETHPDFIKPSYRKNEVIAFINQGLQDISISRTTFTWGIPLELEEGHIIYVWFDALTTYLTGAGYSNRQEFDEYWTNAEVAHVVGKDILRFHAMLWPAMLMSVEEKLPDTLGVHGWWTVEGVKMSKSIGNVVHPEKEIEKYGLDAFRYYLMRESTFGQDADYSKKAMVNRINADLANDLGNLLNRTLGMQKKYFDSIVKKGNKNEEIDKEIIELWNVVLEEVRKGYNDYAFSEVLKSIWKYISRMNKYIDETEPWKLVNENKERLQVVMYNLVESLYKVAIIVSPFMPDTSNKILGQLNISKKAEEILLKDIEEWGNYPDNNKLNDAYVLFPRMEHEIEEYNKELKINNPINIEDFSKVQIRVVEIVKAELLKDSNRLLRIIIDTGTEKRQVLSGIAKYYKAEELVGKKVMAVINLESIKLQNEDSQAMILTATEKKKITVIEVPSNIKNGTIIK